MMVREWERDGGPSLARLTLCCLCLELPDGNVDGYADRTTEGLEAVGREFGQGDTFAGAELLVDAALVSGRTGRYGQKTWQLPFDTHDEVSIARRHDRSDTWASWSSRADVESESMDDA